MLNQSAVDSSSAIPRAAGNARARPALMRESHKAEFAFGPHNGHELDYSKVVSPKVLLLREELQYEDID